MGQKQNSFGFANTTPEAEDLRKYRTNILGCTVKEMADLLNTPKSTYEKWENGTRRIPGIVWVIIGLKLTREVTK